MSTDHKQVELEIFCYKVHTLPKQLSLIIEKLKTAFSKCDLCGNDCSYTNADALFIQAPLKLGIPMETQLHDEITYDKSLQNGDNLEFEKAKKSFRKNPKLRSVTDFFETIVQHCTDFNREV